MEVKHISEILPITVWQSIVNQLAYETQGFTLPLADLTPEEIVQIKPVPREVLEYVSRAIKAVHPKHHAELRRATAYLNTLHDLQKHAWRQIIAKYEAEQERLTAYIQKIDGSR